MFTDDVVRRLFPEAPKARRAAFVAQASGLFSRYELTPGGDRLAFFLAQIGHESSGLAVVAENLNYSAAGLRRVWPKRFTTDAIAAAYANQPEAIANRVYGARLGNIETGDGYRFRGRGYIQLTGRDAYRAVGRLTGLPLECEPSLARETDHLLLVACAFWAWKNLNPICDTGDFVEVTRRINGGMIGLAERRQWLAHVRDVLEASTPQPATARSATTRQPVPPPVAKAATRPIPPAVLAEPRGPQA